MEKHYGRPWRSNSKPRGASITQRLQICLTISASVLTTERFFFWLCWLGIARVRLRRHGNSFHLFGESLSRVTSKTPELDQLSLTVLCSRANLHSLWQHRRFRQKRPFHSSRFESTLRFPQVRCDRYHIFMSDASVSVIGKRFPVVPLHIKLEAPLCRNRYVSIVLRSSLGSRPSLQSNIFEKCGEGRSPISCSVPTTTFM